MATFCYLRILNAGSSVEDFEKSVTLENFLVGNSRGTSHDESPRRFIRRKSDKPALSERGFNVRTTSSYEMFFFLGKKLHRILFSRVLWEIPFNMYRCCISSKAFLESFDGSGDKRSWVRFFWIRRKSWYLFEGIGGSRAAVDRLSKAFGFSCCVTSAMTLSKFDLAVAISFCCYRGMSLIIFLGILRDELLQEGVLG